MTKTNFSLLAAAALLAACGQQDLSADGVRNALPASDAVQIGTPEAQTAAAALTASTAALTAPQYPAEYARVSYWTAVTVNVGVRWALSLVETITQFPPTHRTADSATWGPWIGDDRLNAWKLVVTKVGEGYEYALSGRPVAGGAEAVVLSGVAYPGADRWHGNGTLAIDFDAEASLAHLPDWTQENFGRIDATYDNRTARSIGAIFLGARNRDPADPHLMNAAYAFDAGATGGELQVGFERLDTLETVKLHTRWNHSGAGRGDAQHVAGADTLSGSQCWSAAPDFSLVFDNTSGADVGDETLCAYRPAAYPTIAIPAP